VFYCDERCKQADKRFHVGEQCDRMIEEKRRMKREYEEAKEKAVAV